MNPAPAHASALDFSLFRGGPWFRIEERLGLDRPISAIWPHVSRFLAGLLIGWVPLAVLSLFEGGTAFNRFLADRVVQAGALFAIPVLLALEPYTDGRIRIAASRPIALKLLAGEDEVKYHAALNRAARWRDSGAAQLVLLVIVLGFSVAKYSFGFGARVLSASPERPLTPTVAWYFAVTLPLFWLGMLMWTWRFVTWSELLYQLSRLRLQIVPTHADRTGGMRFLANAQASFAPAVFALGCVLTGITQFDPSVSVTEGLLNYSRSHAVFAVVCFIVLNLPLASFSPKLLQAKRESDASFSELVATHARNFQRRWFDVEHRTDPLGRPDFSSMIDLSSSYEIAGRMRWFPYSFRATIAIIGAALGSLIPRLLMQRQFLDAATGVMPKLF